MGWAAHEGEWTIAPTWAFAPAVDLVLDCDDGAQPAGFTWRAGVARSRGHGSDADRALAVLAGAEPPCRVLAALWPMLVHATTNDLVRTAYARRTGAWTPTPPLDVVPLGVLDRTVQADRALDVAVTSTPADPWLGAGWAIDAEERRRAIAHLHASQILDELPPEVRALLVASAAAPATPEGWAKVPPDNRLDLDQLATDVVAAAGGPSGLRVGIDLWSIGEVDDRTRVTVATTWLADVWLPGAAVVDGHVVVALAPTGERTARARTLAPTGTAATTDVHHDGRAWHLGRP